jgi:hypothetical protein
MLVMHSPLKQVLEKQSESLTQEALLQYNPTLLLKQS